MSLNAHRWCSRKHYRRGSTSCYSICRGKHGNEIPVITLKGVINNYRRGDYRKHRGHKMLDTLQMSKSLISFFGTLSMLSSPSCRNTGLGPFRSLNKMFLPIIVSLIGNIKQPTVVFCQLLPCFIYGKMHFLLHPASCLLSKETPIMVDTAV